MVLYVLRMQEKAKAVANIPLLPKLKKLSLENQPGEKRKENQASELNLNFWLCELPWKENR